MSLKIEKSFSKNLIESKNPSRFSTLVSSLALSISAMVGNLDVVDAQEPAPVMVNESDQEYTDYTSFQLRLYADDNSEHMYEIMPFVRGKFNYLLPVDFTNAGLYIASTYFSETNKKKIKKNRSLIESKIKSNATNLPTLQNDTDNIIEFNSDFNSDENKIKRNFWDLFKKNE